jgi:hypothetical protein
VHGSVSFFTEECGDQNDDHSHNHLQSTMMTMTSNTSNSKERGTREPQESIDPESDGLDVVEQVSGGDK